MPDIRVHPDEALGTAHSMALETLLERETGEKRRFLIEWALRGLKASRSPIELEPATLNRYVGRYGPRTLLLDGQTLYYQREHRPRFELFPLGDHWFGLRGLDYFRIRFQLDDEGTVTALVGVYDDGSESRSMRSTVSN